jgi:zinc and cadmium transporter
MVLLWWIILAVLAISSISLIGISTLAINKEWMNKALRFLVAFSAGSLLATSFLELIPESYEHIGSLIFVVVGIIIFFIIEATIHWHHHVNDHGHHETGEMKKLHPVVHLTILGDSIHNFLDGVIIAASFLVSIPAGIATTIAIAAHEIPQEMGDFAVLVSGGLRRKRAILLNFISATFAILGGIAGYFLLNSVESLVPFITAIAAGGFIYIAATDLLPRLQEEKKTSRMIIQLAGLILGITIIAVSIALLEGH